MKWQKHKDQLTKAQLDDLPAIEYRPPSQATLNESMRIISKLIELNNRNFTKNESSFNHHPPLNDHSNNLANNVSNKTNQQDRSLHELTVDNHHRKSKIDNKTAFLSR